MRYLLKQQQAIRQSAKGLRGFQKQGRRSRFNSRHGLRNGWARLPWDGIFIGISCLVLLLRLMGHFPTMASMTSGASVQGQLHSSPSTSSVNLPSVNLPSANLATNSLSLLQPPLSTRGSEIVDAQGKVVTLRGVNWFGLETENHAPHGLWARDYGEMLAQIKGLGYNVIRLPYSVQGLQDKQVTGIDFRIGRNRELEGKTPIEVMDMIIQEANRQGLLILLDSHRLNNRRIPPLWYGDGFTETDWIRAWAILAERYKNQPNVIGADLKNEPHGVASWGTGNRRTDWRLAAERAGNAILNINPNWLIVVEGVEWNVPGQRLAKHWMGGNLEGVKRFPVRLNRPNKVVYSPHEYGPGVFNQKWFKSPDFPNILYDRWDKGFFYIVREEIAPVLIGEFGGKKVDRDSKEGQWQNLLVDFIAQNQLSYAYWSWNPNSGDTGGILKDDWKTIQQAKQTMLDRTLPAISVAVQPGQLNINQQYRFDNPTPSGTTSSKPSPSPQPTGKPTDKPTEKLTGKLDQLQIKTSVQSEWQTGLCMSIEVTNVGNLPVSRWQLQFDMPNAKIDQSWNGEYRQQNNQYIVTPAEWGRNVQPKQVIKLGFCANQESPQTVNIKPTNFQIIGTDG
jgi:endoglucanase